MNRFLGRNEIVLNVGYSVIKRRPIFIVPTKLSNNLTQNVGSYS